MIVPHPVPQPTRRLIIAVLASMAAHVATLVALARAPAPAPYAEPLPLTVEIRRRALADAGATVALDMAAPQHTALPAAHDPASSPPRAGRRAPDTPSTPPGWSFDPYYKGSEVDVRAQPINEVHLLYPKAAYEMRLRGRVVVSIFISQHGTIDALSVVEADPPGLFEDHALAAARTLLFAPALKGGRAVRSQKLIEVVFDPYESINVP